MELKQYADRYVHDENAKEESWKIKLLTKNLKKDAGILDIGLGAANLYYALGKPKNYFAIDYNPEIVKYWIKKGLKVKQCDVAKDKIPYKDSQFDVVWCSHVLEHMSAGDQINFFKEISRVLKKGGKVIIFSPTPYNWYFYDDLTHVRPCTHGQLLDLARNSGFKFVESKYSFVRFLPQGMQSLIRLPPMRFFLWEVYLVATK